MWIAGPWREPSLCEWICVITLVADESSRHVRGADKSQCQQTLCFISIEGHRDVLIETSPGR